jgi:hypothetical protein
MRTSYGGSVGRTDGRLDGSLISTVDGRPDGRPDGRLDGSFFSLPGSSSILNHDLCCSPTGQQLTKLLRH